MYNPVRGVVSSHPAYRLCDSCGNHVFAFRQACPRCNTAKQHHQDVGWADAYIDTPKQRTASPRHKPGDWDCSACGFHNFASRHVCFRCKESRPDGVSVFVSGMRGTANAFPELYKPGDWECPSCKAHNYSSRLACFRCRLPKTHEARVFGGDPNRRVTRGRTWRDGSCNSKGLPEVESEEESSTFAESSAKTKQNHYDH